MAESAANAIQIGIFTALGNSAPLVAALASRIGSPASPAIYDSVPQPADSGVNSIFPYLVIGDDDLNNWSTDTASGQEVLATVHSWSRALNKRESNVILGEVYNALHRQELSTPDHEFLGCEFETQGPIVLDPDMETYHGTITFRILIDEPGYGE